ncbi:MAG: universal stress protein [Gammaproteobacteria bacterium]|nr:universal stress protein [Gammaproteobacteria bacterium]
MFKHILLPVDLQETALSERAVDIATELAKQHGSQITVITVIPDFGMPLVASYFPAEAMEKAKKEVCAELKRYIAARFNGLERINSHVDAGSPHKAIVKYATGHDIDLIIVPARAKDISKVFLGSCSTHVAERAPCTVMVVRP